MRSGSVRLSRGVLSPTFRPVAAQVEDRTRVSETKKLQDVLFNVRDETIARVDDCAERSFAQVGAVVGPKGRAVGGQSCRNERVCRGSWGRC